MPWKDVINNNLTLEQLNSISGDVVIDFRNNDFFDKNNFDNPLYKYLSSHLGSDDNVSAIISIRSEAGSSSSSMQRKCFDKLTNNFVVTYNNKKITLTKSNYLKYALKRIKNGGKGNDTWSEFLFISIKGGQQDTIETHKNQEITLFNPACEYANPEVILDLNLVLAYFALFSIDKQLIIEKKLENDFIKLKTEIEKILKDCYYNLPDFSGTLYDYCTKHYSLIIKSECLCDPIQLKPISIFNFSNKERAENSIDLTHNESVNKSIFYWDEDRKCILSPARPTNVFWSFHLSNIMQQNFTLEEYFINEKNIFLKRQELF